VRVGFAGTPEFAQTALEALLRCEGVSVAVVYTQPDRPAGRGRELKPSAVKTVALAQALPLRQPLSLKDPAEQAALAAFDLDLLIVVAYGMLLPQAVLDLPRYGCWNLHASLLPRWRGAAPIQRAIEAGDAETGVALMQMDAGLDTGPVHAVAKLALDPNWTSASAYPVLAELGAQLLPPALRALAAGRLPPPTAQSAIGVTHARKLSKDEALLDFSQSALALQRKVRAFNPNPICSARLGAMELKVYDAHAIAGATRAAPGSVLDASPGELWVATGDGILALDEVQRPGGKRLSAREFLHARPTF
jgi:methionyl-tRNA formyltransferase